MDDLTSLQARIRDFVNQRDWSQYHSPKNLSMALSVEAAELVEIFQWLTEQQSQQLDGEKRQQAADELADIFYYLLRIADVMDIDLVQALGNKMQKNQQKYPADQVRGDARKYTEYPDG